MTWLLRDNWLGSLLAFLLGATITWLLLDRRTPAPTPAKPAPAPIYGSEQSSPPAATPPLERSAPAPLESPAGTVGDGSADGVGFSELMGEEPTLFDDLRSAPGETVGRYGEGSADAVPHQGPPDGFTIKGNAQSMLFHTPDSPYYGRTKPEVWFRTEADAERAGFTKYVRRPRKSANPRD